MSELHVDLIYTNWLAGTRRAVARVEIDGAGALVVEPEHWVRQLPALRGGGGDAKQALSGLHTKIDGTHVQASQPHEDGECPFANSRVVELERVADSAEALIRLQEMMRAVEGWDMGRVFSERDVRRLLFSFQVPEADIDEALEQFERMDYASPYGAEHRRLRAPWIPPDDEEWVEGSGPSGY